MFPNDAGILQAIAKIEIFMGLKTIICIRLPFTITLHTVEAVFAGCLT